MPETRMTGLVASLWPMPRVASRYGGSYGVIRGADGQPYVFSGGHVFRNMSHPYIGANVTFTVLGLSYATNIDVLDKSYRGSFAPSTATLEDMTENAANLSQQLQDAQWENKELTAEIAKLKSVSNLATSEPR